MFISHILLHICETCNYRGLDVNAVMKVKCPHCGFLTEDRWLDEEKKGIEL